MKTSGWTKNCYKIKDLSRACRRRLEHVVDKLETSRVCLEKIAAMAFGF